MISGWKSILNRHRADSRWWTGGSWIRLQMSLATCRGAYAGLRVPQSLPHIESILRRRSEQSLHRHHERSHVLRRRRFAASTCHANGNASGLRCALQLLAPILAFTAEEAWSYRGTDGSIHLETFPEGNSKWFDRIAHAKIEHALALKPIIGREIERAQNEKRIGKPLEARVVLTLPKEQTTHDWIEDNDAREELFILSDLTIEIGHEISVDVTRTPNKKCARCWRHRPTVGTIATHPDLCDRCAAVMESCA